MVEYNSCTITEGVLNPKHYPEIIIGRHEYRSLFELFTFMFRHRSYASKSYPTEFETKYFPDINALADCLEGAIILVAEYNNEFLHKLLSPEYGGIYDLIVEWRVRFFLRRFLIKLKEFLTKRV